MSSASSCTSGVFSQGIFRRDRVDLDLVTRPSLSSLKLVVVSAVLLGGGGMDLGCSLAAGAAFGLVGFATRDATFALGGRGMAAGRRCKLVEVRSREWCRGKVHAIGLEGAATVQWQW